MMNSNKNKGFTIVEVLVVILLISLLAVFMVPRFMEQAKTAKWDLVKPEIAILEQALELFNLHCGRYPTQSEGLQALRIAPPGSTEKWRGPYVKKDVLKDSWGNDFIYVFPGKKNPRKIVPIPSFASA